MLEIKLPKCLTEKERNIIIRYNESILSVLTEEERNRKIPRFLASVDNPTRGPRYRPFKSLGDVDTDTECFNQKLYKGLLDAVKENSLCNAAPTPEITLHYFNGAYAMAIHSLNHKNPELYYEEHYRNIWWTGIVDADWGNEIDVTMEHICACMVYRILEYEKNPRYDLLLQEIKHLIENSYFVEHNTLDCFKLTKMGEGTPQTPPTSADTNTDFAEEGEGASYEAHSETTTSLSDANTKNECETTYSADVLETIDKVFTQDPSEFIIEGLKKCLKIINTDADYTLLEYTLYHKNYIKSYNAHKEFIYALRALDLIIDDRPRLHENMRQKVTALKKKDCYQDYTKWNDKSRTDKCKCDKFAFLLEHPFT